MGKKARSLDEKRGIFLPHAREDHAESEIVFKAVGKTREQVYEERKAKKASNRRKDQALALRSQQMGPEGLSDAQLDAELALREQRRKDAAEKAKNPPKAPEKAPEPKVENKKGQQAAKAPVKYSEMSLAEIKALLDTKGILYNPKSPKPGLVKLLEKDGVTGTAEDGEDEEDDSL